MAGYWFVGLWTPAVNYFYVSSLPGVILAVWLGRVIHTRIRPHRFALYIYWALIAIGAVLLVQSVM